MKIGPKYKIAKRLGPIFEKTQTQKFALAMERKAPAKGKRPRGATEYGKQLLEKQKVRLTYGLTERQFSNYVKEAMETKGETPVDMLHRYLEIRLDNIVYRLGLAPTRRAARQMVSHGHIMVNGRKTTVPSRRVFLTDRISVRAGSKSAGYFTNFEEKFMERPMPSWLSWNPKEMEGAMTELPNAQNAPVAGDFITILSFYSR